MQKILQLRKIAFIPVWVILITFISASVFESLTNTTVIWMVGLITVVSVLWCKSQYFIDNPKNYRIVAIYFVWMLIGVIRGCFVADNYWEVKQLISGSFCLSLPVFIYAFSIPYITQKTLQIWVRIALPAFGLFFFLMVADAYHFYLAPVFLLGCFVPVLPKKWKIILLLLLLLMLVCELDARSQMIKSFITLMMCMAYWLKKHYPENILKWVHGLCYLVPIVILALALTDVYNPLQTMAEEADERFEYMTEEGEASLATDSRTFIYEEVIASAVEHEYIWVGRTPARGNDSWFFGAFNAEELKTGKYERHMNELCHPNVFTWLGLIGVALYSLMYFKSSRLALFKSNNLWMKLLGVYIAFRWAYGWIEDINELNIRNVALWMTIAMGFSEKFRQMTDEQMNSWIVDIFKGKIFNN